MFTSPLFIKSINRIEYLRKVKCKKEKINKKNKYGQMFQTAVFPLVLSILEKLFIEHKNRIDCIEKAGKQWTQWKIKLLNEKKMIIWIFD